MNARRRWLGGWAVAWMAPMALLSACAAPGLVEDRDYVRLDRPQPPEAAGGIEVVEFFWYGCPHCADMQPRLQRWSSRQPADVVLRYEPVALAAKWEPGARLHAALGAVGALQRAGDVYVAVQLDGLDLADETAVLDWAERSGLDRRLFAQAWHSPGADRQVARSRDLATRYQLKGVPVLVVDGRYLTSNAYTGSADQTLKTVDALVEKVRADRAGRR